MVRAVIDPGQHYQRRDGGDLERQWQQHRDGRERTEPRQHADQRTDRGAEEAIQEILRRQRDGEALLEMPDQVHESNSRLWMGKPRP
jgi:hypothetical protein